MEGPVCACYGPLPCERAYCGGVICWHVFTVNTGEALCDVPCCYFVRSVNALTGSWLSTDQLGQALTFKSCTLFFTNKCTLLTLKLCCDSMICPVVCTATLPIRACPDNSYHLLMTYHLTISVYCKNCSWDHVYQHFWSKTVWYLKSFTWIVRTPSGLFC